ncbi:hypothetical protein UA18_02404 [Burkholderia multivorans]|uniref:DUF1376 domain-containing protein n=1 Tax=Burkholderia multivorans TaxID=87883 RepID=A0ABD7LJD7_9BURK|nr:hypothetical protein [Burkholderia multivorans]SAK20199.1 hypothetical protein UA18_02404 [Burkholderia multivorans]
MARIRTIKPDFWTDEKIVDLSFEARLFFIGSWNFADDNGNLQRSAKKLKMQIFPADSIDCEPIIQSLIAHGMLSEYEVNGEKYLHINGFRKHQVINRPSKTGLPMPESDSTPTPLTEPSLTERKGKEGKGKEENHLSNTDGGTPSRASTEEGFLTAAGISMSLIGWERERGKAARNMTPSQQQVIDLAGMQVTAAELRKAYDAAVADRLATNDPAPVNAGFVRAKLEGVRRPPVKREDNSWKRTPAGIERKASELGVVCPPGRDHAWLLEKCESVMRQRAREVAA